MARSPDGPQAGCTDPAGVGPGRPDRGARRREVVALGLGAAAAACVAALPGHARAQPSATTGASDAYPSRPIRLIQPFSAGSGPDIVTRFVVKGMAERLGQNVVVEHRVGGTGLIGMQELARAAPDGYTIGYTNIAIPVVQELLAKGTFSLVRDVVPVGGSSRSINVLVVSPSLPARTVAELVALLKARPGAYSYASGGNGTPAHLNGETFKRDYGVDAVHVPYKGLASAITDMARGDVHFLFGTSGSMAPAIQAGRVRALAIAGPRRLPVLPDVPTMAEAGFPNTDVQSWAGLVAPAGTPADVVARLSHALRAVLADPATARFMEANGSEPFQTTPEEFGRLLASESERWRRFVRETGLKVD
jgi:tripartite-type tricarboxylate transporter receptor subunit TctC